MYGIDVAQYFYRFKNNGNNSKLFIDDTWRAQLGIIN